MNFAVGDVVTLKSGSPRMTVVTIFGDRATCVYFRDRAIARSEFPLSALEPIDPPGSANSFWARLFGRAHQLQAQRSE